MALKPYQTIPIQDNGDRLVPIPPDRLGLTNPHPYQALGAPYGDRSPFYLRSAVVERLLQAQDDLERSTETSPLRLQIFDAYRPVAVQQFMVDYTLEQLAAEQGWAMETLTTAQRQALEAQVQQFWAAPSANPATPPPHSTGGAVDLTLVNAEGVPLDMGSPIDECSPRSYPDHFAQATTAAEQRYHHHRLLLRQVMLGAGFCNHPYEWWHFSYGDQLWAWLQPQETIACYGGVML